MTEQRDSPQTDLDWVHVFRAGSPTASGDSGPPGSDPTDVSAPVLLMLHGTGGDEQEILTLADALDPGATVLAPRGRVTEGGMLRWFRRLSEGVFDVEDVVLRAGELAGFIAQARQHYDLDGRRIIAVGFSNGANIALATALLHPDVLDRVVAFSGMFPLDDRALATDLADTTVLMLNGRSDLMAPLASADRAVATLIGRGAQVDRELRDGGHGIAATDVAAARAWLARPMQTRA
ncbi:alpha/beta hydrolase [Cryobacterium sp. TMT1-62]|uniref:alpha/beta hydrolase n=1 Tax=unclassified Cryobacterium TaxID=2649013 RepID=UPI000CE36022|nr:MULTISPECIES: alpha/beta hydrolase [unclassified Cryobacterium]TFB53543.1 alpha/beta hydrolase [Cryobacterium sp. Sr3]TFC69362.1 alpha/beta hydrolase [Cryobacterium sp. TMT2-4]TFD32100.1 alpha/beta hydrolase [Cryobacterium sp. TMT1-62]